MITLRTARPQDAEAIARVYVETWRDTYAGLVPDRVLIGMSERRQTVLWSYALRDQQVMVASSGESGVIGFGSCGAARGVDLPYQGEIFTLYVLPDFQGRGIGKRLLGALFGMLLRRGMDSALIWVLADNPARFFYHAMGGRWTATREEDLWGAALPEQAYGWSDLRKAIASTGP